MLSSRIIVKIIVIDYIRDVIKNNIKNVIPDYSGNIIIVKMLSNMISEMMIKSRRYQ